jgi:predicted ATPase
MAVRAGLVGRADELSMLAESLGEAGAGHGSMVLVTGEAGVGKTRVLSELARRASREGAAVAWGRCREDGGVPPFHPWVEVLRGVVEDVDLSLDELSRRWPDVGSMLTTVPTGALPYAHPSERFRLFVSVGSLLAHCAERALVVVAIDDLHRADEASLGLLRFLAPDLPRWRVLVVGAYRDSDVDADHPLTATLAQLADGPRPCFVHLGGLDAHGVAELLDHHGGPVSTEPTRTEPTRPEPIPSETIPADIVQTVTARTGGNPLFADRRWSSR